MIRLFFFLAFLFSSLQSWSAELAQNGIVFRSFGRDVSRGNIVGISPAYEISDYFTRSAYLKKTELYFEEAARLNLLRPNTVVVLPELASAWLVFLGEAEETAHARSLERAMLGLLWNHATSALAHLRPWTKDQYPSGLKNLVVALGARALFLARSEVVLEAVHEVFSHLAKKYRVTLVAGSAFLPDVSVRDGLPVLSKPTSQLYNLALVYRPDGKAYPDVVRKLFPTREEGFVSAGDPGSLPVFQTPIGKLGVLICADAWFKASYRALGARGADVIVVPAMAISDHDHWVEPWGGYNVAQGAGDLSKIGGGFFPDESALKEKPGFTEGDAWTGLTTLPGLKLTHAEQSLTIFFSGRLFEKRGVGRHFSVGGKPRSVQSVQGPSVAGAVLNLWRESKSPVSK